jgi:hypothetical protein
VSSPEQLLHEAAANEACASEDDNAHTTGALQKR